MRCTFVLDLLNGEVVHAVRGERSSYRPVHEFSRIVSNSNPTSILELLRPDEIYVADLNRIQGRGDNLKMIDEMSKKVRVMADIGLAEPSELDLLPVSITPVVGTETCTLDLIKYGTSQRPIVVSIDMKRRVVLTGDPKLKLPPLDLLAFLNDYPIESVILLELDRVGTSSGLDTSFLKAAVAASGHPIIVGGGVRDDADLETLDSLGVAGALVATAVHNGAIPVSCLRS